MSKSVNVVEMLTRILIRIGNIDDIKWLKNELAVSGQTQLLQLFDLPALHSPVNATIFATGFADFSQRMREGGTMQFEGSIKELIKKMKKAGSIPDAWNDKQAATVAGQVFSNPENGFSAIRSGVRKGLKHWEIKF